MRRLFLVYGIRYGDGSVKVHTSRHGLWVARQTAKRVGGEVEIYEWLYEPNSLMAMKYKWVAKLDSNGERLLNSEACRTLAAHLWGGLRTKRHGSLKNLKLRQIDTIDKEMAQFKIDDFSFGA
jgi:hypothetical protein